MGMRIRPPRRFRSRLVAAGLAVLALLPGGCAFTEFDAPLGNAAQVPEMVSLAPKVQEIFGSLKLPGAPEISAIRKAHPLAMADWVMCLRSDAPDGRQTYALLIRESKIAAYRTAVGIDQCDRDEYAPLQKVLAQDWRWDMPR
jgi:hypothetical protein